MPINDPSALPLRDIHLPDSVSWWPLAPGWWLLLSVIIVLLLGGIYFYRRRKRYQASVHYSSMLAIENMKQDYRQNRNDQQLLQELSALLRRVAISIYPRVDTASLAGDDWLRFLDQAMSDQPFSQGTGKVLVTAPYQPNVNIDSNALIVLTEDWIKTVTHPRYIKTAR